MRIGPTGKSSLTPCRRLFGFVACAFGGAYSSSRAVLLQSWAGSGLAGRWAWAAVCVVLLLAVYAFSAERITLNSGGDIHMRVAGGAMGVFIGGVVLIFKGVRGLAKLLGASATRLQRARRSRNGKASDNLMDATDVGSPATMVLSTVRGASAWLVVRSGADSGSIVEIKGDRVTIGSSPDSDVRLEHRTTSPVHALIRVNRGEYALADVGSRTGTFVNGELESGVLIGDGSTITLGSSELFFSQVGDGGEKKNGSAGTGGGVLLVRSGPSMGQSFQVGRGDFTIGRKPGEGGIQIDDPTVSQRHALIRCMSRVCRLYDVGSANGTKVDDVVIQGVTLHNGDILRFGEAEVQFVHEDSPG